MVFMPMLAKPYLCRLPPDPIFVQPKLDGIRMIATSQGLFTRGGCKIKVLTHIEAALRLVFEADPTTILDGELFSPQLNLMEIISASRTPASPGADQARGDDLAFHIFDAAHLPGPFADRLDFLRRLFDERLNGSPALRLVPTVSLSTATQVDDHYRACLSAGFEGQILRLDAHYSPGRSGSLVKRKPFVTAEYPIQQVHAVKGNGGYAQRCTLALPDGRTFGAGITATRTLARQLLRQPPTFATVRFWGRTPSGIPRSPSVVAWYDGPRLN